MNGWIKLHRSLLDSELFQDERVLRVFCWCLLKANVKASRYHGVDVPTGSFVAGSLQAAGYLNLSRAQYRTAISKLRKMGCISTKPTNQFTVISITNWGLYQDRLHRGDGASEVPETPASRNRNQQNCGRRTEISSQSKSKVAGRNQRLTSEQPTNHQQVPTEEEGHKERRKEANQTASEDAGSESVDSKQKGQNAQKKSRRYTPAFEHFWQAYWNRKNKLAAAKAFPDAIARIVDDAQIPEAADEESALRWLIRRTQRYARHLDEATAKLHASTFLNQDRFLDELEPTQTAGHDQPRYTTIQKRRKVTS